MDCDAGNIVTYTDSKEQVWTVDIGEKRNERDTGVTLQEVEVVKIDEFTYHSKQ